MQWGCRPWPCVLILRDSAPARRCKPPSGWAGSDRVGRCRSFWRGWSRGASEAAIKAAVREAARAATDFSWLSRGDSVFIKPALNSGIPYPSTTSPIAIAAMVELLREKGARRVIVGDMSGIGHVKLSPDGLSGSSRRLMEASGMARAARAAGAELHFFEEAGWDAFYEDPMAAGVHWKRGLMMPRYPQGGRSHHPHAPLRPPCPGRQHPGAEGGGGVLAHRHAPRIPSGRRNPP